MDLFSSSDEESGNGKAATYTRKPRKQIEKDSDQDISTNSGGSTNKAKSLKAVTDLAPQLLGDEESSEESEDIIWPSTPGRHVRSKSITSPTSRRSTRRDDEVQEDIAVLRDNGKCLYFLVVLERCFLYLCQCADLLCRGTSDSYPR